MTYKYLENVAIADIAVEIKAKTLKDLFIDGAMALEESMADLNFDVDCKKTIKLSAKSIDILFFDWLSELVFLKDSNQMIFNKFDIEISENGYLHAAAYGTTIDKLKEEKNDVKAITMHNFKVEKKENYWYAFVVFDI